MHVAKRLSTALAVLMAIQAVTGLSLQRYYKDAGWIRATWFANDWVTAVVAVPLLSIGLVRAARGSVRGELLSFGLSAYAAYNYSFYLFGAALNPFFLIYVVAFVLAVGALVLGLSQIDVVRVAGNVRATVPVRIVAGSLVLIGMGLACVWIGMWAAYVFAGRPTVEPNAFRLVAALDLTLLVPVLTVGGGLLWRRKPWGYVLAAIASIQGALYLLVLSVNSAVAIHRGITPAPGELPLWGALAVFTTALAVVLLASIPDGGART